MPILNHFPSDPRAQANFAFDHAQAHAALAYAMGSSNVLLDPMINAIGPMNWGLNHQIAHDYASNFFQVKPSFDMADETTGSPIWTFWNWQEHDALSGAALKSGS